MPTEPPNAEPPKRKRRWFQFSLRSLLKPQSVDPVRSLAGQQHTTASADTFAKGRHNYATNTCRGALAIAFAAVLNGGASAHPSSGIVVDQKGQVFFQDIVGGAIWKIDERGKLSKFADVKGGHWLALDAEGKFSKATPKYYQRITPDGVKPALIHADGGAPLVVNSDGNLYYASGDKDDRPGGLALTRETPDGTRTSFSPALTKVLHQIDDGITGLASGPDGSLYVACWTAVFKVKMDGTVTTLAHPITVKDCDEDKADHKASSRLPLSERSGGRLGRDRVRGRDQLSLHHQDHAGRPGRDGVESGEALVSDRRRDPRSGCIRLGIHQCQRPSD